MPARRGLNERQQQFALFVAQGMTAVDAALAAGYAQTTASQNASKLLVHVGVKQEIERQRHALHLQGERINVTADWIVSQAALIARDGESESARVQSLRLLADIQGMLQGGNRDVPEAARQLMEAIGAGAAREMSRRKLDASEAREVRQLPTGHTE